MVAIMLQPEDDEVVDDKREDLIEWTANSLYAGAVGLFLCVADIDAYRSAGSDTVRIMIDNK